MIGHPYISLKMSGVNQDTPAHELPPESWSDCRNMRFRDDSAQQIGGYEQVWGTIGFAPQYALSVPVYPVYYWIYAGASAIKVTDGTTHYDITHALGVAADLDVNWNGGVFNGVAVLNNGFDEPMWWNGSTGSAVTTLPAWPASAQAKIIQPYKQYLIALHYNGASGLFPDMVKWSHAADPGSVPASWDETDPTKDAGEYTLSDTPGGITAGAQLGENFIIYKYEHCYVMQYVGGRYIFSFKKALAVGAINQECVATVDNKHVVMGAGDIVIHDTFSAQSIVDKKMRSWLFRQINPDYMHRSYILPYHEVDELWFCFPSGEAELANTALIWNYRSNLFSVADIPSSRHMAPGVLSGAEVLDWDSDTGTWDADETVWNERTYSAVKDTVICSGTTDSKIFEMDTTSLFDGVGISTYTERLSMPVLDMESLKLVKAVWPKVTADPGTVLNIRIGAQMMPADPVDWTPELPFVVGTDKRVCCLVKGRYISGRVESSGATGFKLHSLDFETEKAERF